MRVIGGRFRGRRLHSAKAPGLRPTADRVREALFNILGDTIVDARVLDLYSGTGALGLEALSRGAARATFIERDPGALRSLRRNVAELEVQDRVEVTHGEAIDYCRHIPQDVTSFDVVFCDPPYRDPLGPVAESVVRPRYWERVCVIEHAAGQVFPECGDDPRHETRRYGDTALTIFWRS